MLQLLIEIKGTDTVENLPQDVKDLFISVGGEITDSVCWNTKLFNNKMVVNFVTQSETSSVDSVQSLIDTHSLGWTILAANKLYLGEMPEDASQELQESWPVEQLVRYKKNSLKKYLKDDTNYNVGRFAGLPLFEEDV